MTARIVSRPGLMGGQPCFAGTRIPVQMILQALADGHSSRSIGHMWPAITPDRILDALRFAAQNAGTDVDALRRKNTELHRRCQAAESAAQQTVEQARRAGGSFGRSLANWAARHYELRLKELQRQVLDIAARLEPGAEHQVLPELEAQNLRDAVRWSEARSPSSTDLRDIIAGASEERWARALSSEVWP